MLHSNTYAFNHQDLDTDLGGEDMRANKAWVLSSKESPSSGKTSRSQGTDNMVGLERQVLWQP